VRSWRRSTESAGTWNDSDEGWVRSRIELVLTTPLQQYQHLSKYARWDEDAKRRETWNESIDRYFDFWEDRVPEAVSRTRWQELRHGFLTLDAIGSMRALWTAGPAATKDEVAIYNCSYLTVSRPEAFDEAMYLLMCGVGVGFSVEEHEVRKLPNVPDTLRDPNRIIKVRDSKYGWSESLRAVIKTLYAGYLPQWDTTGIRPRGTVLKTFGGRASGPEPLNQLFHHVVDTFTAARGRKLSSLECHSIMCMILAIVEVGGVRRAAGIDLFSVRDRDMMNAKVGSFPTHFHMTNNSGVFEGQPRPDHFFKYWSTMIKSHGGEPGIFNRAAAQEQAARWGRRDGNLAYGTNPCGEIILRDCGLCNLSAAVARPTDSLDELKRKYGMAVDLGTIQATATNFKHLTPKWQRNAEEERLLGASLDGIPDHPVLNGSEGKDTLKTWLNELRDHGRRVAESTAGRLSIAVPVAIGALKPAGNSSVLHGAASPLKPHHDRWYFRRTRISKNDPMYHFLAWYGFPIEDEIGYEDTKAVITWAVKAPEGARTRHDWSALDMLDLWLTYRDEFCEHNPSCTVNVRDEEWGDVAAWVYRNFGKVTGITFLPHDGGHYRQAPYEDATEAEFDAWTETVPQEVDWSLLSQFETTDLTTGARELACVGGVCEIDLSRPA
jgi:ribonucleoside-triphosphate reductase